MTGETPYDGDDLDEAESAIYRGHGVSASTGLRFIAELRAARSSPGGGEITWRCRSCGDEFEEDDLEQDQPDGHYVCPDCPDDLTIVAIPTGAIRALRSLIAEQALGRPDETEVDHG